MVAAVLSMGAVAALVVAEVAVVAVETARAQNAADAVALAMVDGGRAVAMAVAERHGALVEVVEVGGDTATVTVRFGRISATARASSAP